MKGGPDKGPIHKEGRKDQKGSFAATRGEWRKAVGKRDLRVAWRWRKLLRRCGVMGSRGRRRTISSYAVGGRYERESNHRPEIDWKDSYEQSKGVV